MIVKVIIFFWGGQHLAKGTKTLDTSTRVLKNIYMVEVAVIGGGPAGCEAAYRAAR
jgi:NADPH-dependent 2,4-dienoyl-CoA reductase/sulfur reductase-like enzyme